jgi:hypothetical protein
MLILILLVVVLIVVASLPWYNAVNDLLDSKFEGYDKLILFLLISWFPGVGPMIYYSRKKKLNK